MADPTHINAQQARLRQESMRANRRGVLLRLLAEFDPQNSDAALDNAGLLRRAATVLNKAMAVDGEPADEAPLPEEGTHGD